MLGQKNPIFLIHPFDVTLWNIIRSNNRERIIREFDFRKWAIMNLEKFNATAFFFYCGVMSYIFIFSNQKKIITQ
ncbi:MAG: hypothetical protein CM15mP58_11400 [Burkholderiaceae bacterium]|nr:MAG: hypothetical protein CM15mP58_11400 [Burkholderiaceae bacterium]